MWNSGFLYERRPRSVRSNNPAPYHVTNEMASTDPTENLVQRLATPTCSIFPPEILQRIFSQYSPTWDSGSILSEWDLMKLSRISRQFQLIAERELYRHVSIICHEKMRSRRRGGKFGTLEMLCNTLFLPESGPRRLGYMRELTLRYMRCASDFFSTQELFVSLFSSSLSAVVNCF